MHQINATHFYRGTDTNRADSGPSDPASGRTHAANTHVLPWNRPVLEIVVALVVAPGGVGVALRGARAPALGDLVVQAPADGQRDRQRDESRVNTENRRDEQQLTRPNEEDGEIHKREVCEEERRKDWEKDGTMGRKKEKKEGRHR